MTPTIQQKLAVLIDAENTRAAQAPALMKKISEFGRVTVARAYGDWTTPQLSQWKLVLHEESIRPFQQFRYVKGKNSSDCALIMDAMDLLHSQCVDAFCIVSSDSDYTGLVARIKEAGPMVYGFGTRRTIRALVTACDEFVFVDDIACESGLREVPCDA